MDKDMELRIARLETKVKFLEADKKKAKQDMGRLQQELAAARSANKEPSDALRRQVKTAIEERDRAETRERAADVEAAKWRRIAEQAQAKLQSLGHSVSLV